MGQPDLHLGVDFWGPQSEHHSRPQFDPGLPASRMHPINTGHMQGTAACQHMSISFANTSQQHTYCAWKATEATEALYGAGLWWAAYM